MSHHTSDPVDKFYEVYNEKDYNLWNETLTDDYTAVVNGNNVPNRDVGLKFVKAFHDAFPDLTYTIDDTVREGDRVVTRWTARGTHEGEFAGVPPTGKKATMVGITVFKLRDGKIAGLWNVWDTAGLIGQLKG